MAKPAIAARIAADDTPATAAPPGPKLDVAVVIGRHGEKDYEVSAVWRDPKSGQLKWQTHRTGKNGALGQAERLVRVLEDYVIWGRLPKDGNA